MERSLLRTAIGMTWLANQWPGDGGFFGLCTNQFLFRPKLVTNKNILGT